MKQDPPHERDVSSLYPSHFSQDLSGTNRVIKAEKRISPGLIMLYTILLSDSHQPMAYHLVIPLKDDDISKAKILLRAYGDLVTGADQRVHRRTTGADPDIQSVA